MPDIPFNNPTLNWSVTQGCGCTEITFIETTCLSTDENNCDGYGYQQNYDTDYVDRTEFSFITPGGGTYLNKDLGYLPRPLELDGLTWTRTLNQIVTEDEMAMGSTSFEDGVWTIRYIQYHNFGGEQGEAEIHSETRKFLFKCNVESCLEAAMRNIASDCSCDTNVLMDKIYLVRLLIESAEKEFKQSKYDCAQKTIQRAGKICKGMCLDC